MAGTIAISTAVTVANDGFSASFTPTSLSITQTGQGAHETVVSVGTAEEDMPIGDVGTEGWLLIRNIDPTNYVTWGPSSAGVMVPMGRLKPSSDGKGEWALFRMDSTAILRWKANVAAVKVVMKLFED